MGAVMAIFLAGCAGTSSAVDEPPAAGRSALEAEPAPEPAPDPAPTDDPGEDADDQTPDARDAEGEQDSAPQVDSPPAVPDSGAPQARAPPQTQTSDGVLVAALFAEITVAPEQPAGYDRSLFRHWTTSGGCTTRNRVLIRDSDGTAVTSSSCVVTAGTWYSPFDDVWVDVPRSLDIDHYVPLAEAWRSGARDWDEPTRRAFANDLDDPRTLIAVTASSNRSKGDRDPADWLPTNVAYRCDYVGTWVAIKHRWELSVDAREQAAIQRVLDGCGELRTSPTVPARPASGPPPSSATAPGDAPAPAPAGQCVDLNTASSSDLERITGVGPTIAQRIIDARPFSSVDTLTRVSGIGDVRLANIKEQGLACVG